MDAQINGNGFLQGRWPRQETLTLLEVRTRLHPQFKMQAAAAGGHKQLAPLWDEVSRIMAEEHGYQRSGRKCKEKLDNLYKYYKKTKASTGSHHGKHYRFFRQLQLLYGEDDHVSQAQAKQQEAAAQAHDYKDSDDSESTEGEEDDDECMWSLEMKELVQMQVRRLMEVQNSWFAGMVEVVDRAERESASREEAWRKQALALSGQEERLQAWDRAWIEARDSALMDALDRIIGCKCHELKRAVSEEESRSMESARCRKNGGNKVKETELVSTQDERNGEISNLISLQDWMQPEVEYHHGIDFL